MIILFAEERKTKIIEKLQTEESVKVADLSLEFNVSEATIRRDLQELEDKGLLYRTHGGAVLTEHTKFEPTFTEKEEKNLEEKERIGKLAASMIEDGDSIILDSGTTTLYIAKNITAKNVTVVTNSLSIMYELGNRQDVEVIGLGGSLRWETQAMVGPLTEDSLRNIWVDKVFLGANGVSLEQGITTPTLVEAQIKKIMANVGSKVILTTDSTKFEKVTFSKILDLEDIDMIITDKNLSEEILNSYQRAGVKIMVG